MTILHTNTLIDARRTGWFWMEDDIIDRYGRFLGTTGVAVYAYLARRADAKGVSFPSYGTIARDLAISRRTAITYIHKLEKLGLIIVHRREGQGQASNIYQLVNVRGKTSGPVQIAASPPSDPPATAEKDPVSQPIPLAATGEIIAPVQQMHQSPDDFTGETAAPVKSLHRGGVTISPVLVQPLHQGGEMIAPEGNTIKETQKKETQMKEKKDLASRATRAASPNDPSLHSSQKISSFGFLALKSRKEPVTKPRANGHDGYASTATSLPEPEVNEEQPDALAEMLDALAQVTGKNLAFLRPQKQEQFQTAAQKLLDYGFTPEDVRDFGRYWREGHPIGSSKRNAGRPHLSQVLEDLPASREWNQQRREEEVEEDEFYVPPLIIHGDEPVEETPMTAPTIQPVPAQPQSPRPGSAEAEKVWNRLYGQLRLSLVGNPALRALERAKVLGLSSHRLTVLLPDDASADVWRLRMQIPLERAVIRAFDEPLSVLFLGPTEMAMFAQ